MKSSRTLSLTISNQVFLNIKTTNILSQIISKRKQKHTKGFFLKRRGQKIWSSAGRRIRVFFNLSLILTGSCEQQTRPLCFHRVKLQFGD